MDILQVEGIPNETFVRELTSRTAPPKAVSGDVSPVEDVMIFIGERAIYASYDYGRTQVLELEDDELMNLQQTLKNAGLDPTHIIVAPPYVTDSQQ
jgi:hypothetical protein